MAEQGNAPWWTGITPTTQASRAHAHRMAHVIGCALAGTRPEEHPLDLSEAAGATLARDVHARCAVPHYASSAMDGYAVRGCAPWHVVEGDHSVHDAAATALVSLAPGEAVPVVTGGVIPRGTESVIRDEYALRTGTELRARATCPDTELAGAHIRPAGTECDEGELILAAGRKLSPADVAFAAVAAVDTVPAVRAPAVRILLTGSEVQDAGIPAPGHVRDAFSPSLPAIITGLGARVESVRRLPDDPGVLASAIETAVAAEVPLVVTTGGTARSRADHVRAYLERHSTALIDELDLQPGHPTLLAACSPATAVLALPGNPLAAMTALTLLGAPLLLGLTGRAAPPVRGARVKQSVRGSRRERLAPAVRNADGSWSLCQEIGANMLKGLSRADALISVPPAGLSSGAPTDALDLPW